MTDFERPPQLMANAWNGAAAVGELTPDNVWGQRPIDFELTPKLLAPEPESDLRDWRDPRVGWGVILRERPDLSVVEQADVDGKFAALAAIVAQRNGVVLRYVPALGNGYVIRNYSDGTAQQMSVIGSLAGTGRGALPMYLMIYASPADIPWSFQYQLNSDRFVGRLDPTSAGVEHYLAAMANDWSGTAPDVAAPVVWTTNHGGGDITQLMAKTVGDALWASFAEDKDLVRRRRIRDAEATGANLIAALAALKPAFIATTSHGLTGPAPIAPRIGVPVDADFAAIDLDALFDAWSPDGAIWYAHACCSAGSDAGSRFADLFGEQDEMRLMLEAVAADAGACTSPLAQRLLSAASPARAFVGHVEPTFDWTLRDPASGQPLANTLINALYNQLFALGSSKRATPIGYALQKLFDEADAFFSLWNDAISAVNKGVPSAPDWALYRKLVGYDRQGTVILGDPAVALPLPRRVSA